MIESALSACAADHESLSVWAALHVAFVLAPIASNASELKIAAVEWLGQLVNRSRLTASLSSQR